MTTVINVFDRESTIVIIARKFLHGDLIWDKNYWDARSLVEHYVIWKLIGWLSWILYVAIWSKQSWCRWRNRKPIKPILLRTDDEYKFLLIADLMLLFYKIVEKTTIYKKGSNFFKCLARQPSPILVNFKQSFPLSWPIITNYVTVEKSAIFRNFEQKLPIWGTYFEFRHIAYMKH